MDEEGPEKKSFGDRLRDITPDFLMGGANFLEQERARENSGKTEFQKERERENRLNQKKARDGAAGKLGAAEKNATGGGTSGRAGNLAAAARNERNAGGLFTGEGKAPAQSKGGARNFKGRLKKAAPLIAILGLVVAVGGLMMSAQSLMPTAISEMLIEKFNSAGVSSTLASDAWLDKQLNQVVNGVTEKAGNVGEELFEFSEYQMQSLNGTETKVVQDPNGSGKVFAILYRKGDQWIPVVGSKVLAGGGGYTAASIIAACQSATGLSNIGTPISAADALSDRDFKTPYTTASKAWRGGSSGWFDQIMSNITEAKLAIERNRWSKMATKTASNATSEFAKIAASAVKTKTTDEGVVREADIFEREDTGFLCGLFPGWCYNHTDDKTTVVTDTDADTGKYLEKVVPDGEEHVINPNESAASAQTTDEVKSALTSKAIAAASQITNVACSLVEGLVSIYTVVSAYQQLQFLNVISGYLESVDKMKAGYGEQSGIHEYNDSLTKTSKTIDNEGHESETKRSAMESQGMSWLFGVNSKINQNDPSVRNVSMETMMGNLSAFTGNIALTAQVYAGCGYAMAADAIANLASTVISFIPILGQGVKATQLTLKAFTKVAIRAAVTAIFYAMIPMIANKIANSIIKDAATEWLGEDLGNAMISGAGKYLGGNGTSGGQSPGTSAKVLAYLGERDAVIAEEAEYQRAIRSPLDVTSQYTFLGSIAYALLPMAYSSSGVMQAVKSASSVTSSAIIALTPAASAIDEQSVLMSSGECALLDGLEIVGDAYCNPYIITDVSTMEYDPMQVYRDAYYYDGYYLHSYYDGVGVYHYHVREGYSPRFSGGHVATPANIRFDGNGNMIKQEYGETGYEYYSNNLDEGGKVKTGSNLARYLTYCGQRTSQYGIKDATIVDDITRRNSTASKIIGVIPVLGDAETARQRLTEVANMRWTTGEACVASENSETWNENKYYQRYAENERLLENIESGYKSAVTAYAEGYYAENPLDNSFEGQIARFAGMTVEEVDNTLALMEYYYFVAMYDSSDRYAFAAPVVEGASEDEPLAFGDGEVVVDAILPEYIIYNDVRNRVFVV